ncbi:putative membrane protein (plasmid) [Borreliella afzelii PKo]|uniref:Membrane protein n=1 Tax=Borreliella afzelii (strain PKo) TaxID=390236 RepID=G0ITG5_BORAP|nr:putative membrane protein [Borreliella afzelii PKo]
MLLKLFLVFSKFKNKLLTSIIYFLCPYVMYRISNSTFYNIIIYKTHKQVLLSSYPPPFYKHLFFSFNTISIINYSILFYLYLFLILFLVVFFKKIIVYCFLSFFFIVAFILSSIFSF